MSRLLLRRAIRSECSFITRRSGMLMQFLSGGAGLATLSNGSGSVASRLDWLPKHIARSRSLATRSVRDWICHTGASGQGTLPFERDSFPSGLAPLCRRCRGAGCRVIARRGWFPGVVLIFARRSARIRTGCVSGNRSALVLPSVKHFLLQTLSSDRITHRCVLLTLSPVSNRDWLRIGLQLRFLQ